MPSALACMNLPSRSTASRTAHRAPSAAVAGDVGDRHEGARQIGRRRAAGNVGNVRAQAHFDPAHAAMGRGQHPFAEGQRAMGQHLRKVRLGRARHLGTDEFFPRASDDRLRVASEGWCALLVGEAAAEFTGAVMRDQGRYVAGPQAKQPGPRLR